MKRKLFAYMMILCVLLALAAPAAAAEDTTAPEEETTAPVEETVAPEEPALAADQCGDNLTWVYEGGVLTITGQGDMYDYLEGGPWSAHKEEIEKVVLEGVTYIGAYAFRDYDNLTEVDFGEELYEIGMEAFRSCDGLEEIHLPKSFKIFGESSFENCENLKEIHCEGRFPSFRQNSMWQTYATIYFPAEKPWDVELIAQLEEAFHGRIQFLASDGSDPYVPTEPTEEPTEETTEPKETEAPATEEATTIPETEAPTEAPATEAPATEAPTETMGETTAAPETREPEETETFPLPDAVDMERKGPNGLIICVVIIIVILVFAVVGTMVFGKKKGKYGR